MTVRTLHVTWPAWSPWHSPRRPGWSASPRHPRRQHCARARASTWWSTSTASAVECRRVATRAARARRPARCSRPPASRSHMPSDSRASCAASRTSRSNDPCVNTAPANAYWGLYWSDGKSGKWNYSSTGVGGLKVPTAASSRSPGRTAVANDPPRRRARNRSRPRHEVPDQVADQGPTEGLRRRRREWRRHQGDQGRRARRSRPRARHEGAAPSQAKATADTPTRPRSRSPKPSASARRAPARPPVATTLASRRTPRQLTTPRPRPRVRRRPTATSRPRRNRAVFPPGSRSA